MKSEWLSNKPLDRMQEWEAKAENLRLIKLIIFACSIPLIIGIIIYVITIPSNPLALLIYIGIIEMVILISLIPALLLTIIIFLNKSRINEVFFDTDHIKLKLNNKKVIDVKYNEIITVSPYIADSGFFSMKRDPANEAFIIRFLPKLRKYYPFGIINMQIAKMIIDKLRELRLLP